MRYLKKFNENNSNNPTFKEKYSDYIKSGEIIVKHSFNELEIKVKNELDISELEDVKWYSEDEGDITRYKILLPTGLSVLNDYLVFDYDSSSKILELSPDKVKEYIQKEYDLRFKTEDYLKRLKIKEMFREYIDIK
jgi:hypothetical protein